MSELEDAVQARACPVCGESKSCEYGRRGEFLLRECNSCGFVFLARRLTWQSVEEQYQGQSCQRYVEQEKELRGRCERLIDQALKLGLPGGKVLDVGCGAGLFLETARARGLDGLGLEPDPSRVAWCSQHGLNVIQGILPHPGLEGRLFDLVWLSHVLEHVAEPNDLVAELVRLLSPGGMLIITTPNIKSLAARICRCHHRYVIPPEHVSYFGSRSLRGLCERHGLLTERCYSRGGGTELKESLAHIVKFNFLRPAPAVPPKRRFVEGRGGASRATYDALMVVSRLVGPALALMGGEELVGFFRKPRAAVGGGP